MKSILIIEDENDVRKNLEDLLSAEGYEILSATNGVEGYKLAVTAEPDLIISDIRMPVMDGFDLLEKLQENAATELIPFIFLTAKTEIKEMRKGMINGADDYITKPYKAEEVLNAIKTRLKKSEKHLAKFSEFKNILMKRVPHELRTPLVGILGMSGIMIEDIDSMSKPELKEMAEKIQNSGKRLHRRIEKFLTYAEILEESQRKSIGKNKSEKNYKIDDDMLKSELLLKAKELRRGKDIRIEFESADIKIFGWQYEILIGELIENSIKYTRPGEIVNIKGYSSEGYYITEITDSGKRLKDINYEDISFFNQFGGENATEEGLGIGLAIVKKIVESADGYMSFKSAGEERSTVEVGIPIVKSN